MKQYRFLSFLLLISSTFGYQYSVNYHNVLLDHFSFVDNATFPLRYLQNDSFLEHNGPILFYAGNEGDIELFAENTGFMWRAAEELRGSVIFAEHRYYGKSMPFGNESYKDPQHLGYLTSEQALADFVDLLEQKLNPDRSRSVIVFGGSYGGMLSAWMRLKYPHIVVGALASSAPVRQFNVQCDLFNQVLTSVFRVSLDNPICAVNIKNLWPILKNYTSSDAGRKFLNDEYKFCTAFNKTEDFDTFYDYLTDVFGNLAMANYPFEANFLAPLPSYPVREFCGQIDRNFTKDEEFLTAFNNALQVYTNYTGKTKCLDISSAYDTSMGSHGWDFQACTEMIMPMCSNGKTDMFLEKKWVYKEFADECYKKFKVIPRAGAAAAQYGTDRWDTSNIIFSNGLLDPWSQGGLLKSSNDKITVVLIPEGAHHIDLRADNKNDPASVKETRKFYIRIFKSWIDTHSRNQNRV